LFQARANRSGGAHFPQSPNVGQSLAPIGFLASPLAKHFFGTFILILTKFGTFVTDRMSAP
jgi:hypothetical protein